MEIKFNSEKELYERVSPALQAKCDEFKRMGFDHIEMIDIWEYLKEVKWMKKDKILLNEIVSDIFDSKELEIDSYLKIKSLNNNNN